MKQPSGWDGVRRRYAISHVLVGLDKAYDLWTGKLHGQDANTMLQVFPNHRIGHRVGPGVEIKDDPIERRRRNGREMDAYTSLE